MARAKEVAGLASSFYLWLAANSALAYAVNLTNFMVTKYTSALTLQVGKVCVAILDELPTNEFNFVLAQVLGNAKGVIAAIVSVMVFANPVTWRGTLGYAITIFGVVLYSQVSFVQRKGGNIGRHTAGA